MIPNTKGKTMHLPPALESRRAEVRRFVYDELIPLEVETDLAGGRLAPES
jgi:hypothetical protein